MNVLVTGAGGLIGGESVRFFTKKNAKVIGIDNNMRKTFFGNKGNVSDNLLSLSKIENFKNVSSNIINKNEVLKVFEKYGPFDLIIHTAAQPSHDWSRKNPSMDFAVNAIGTMNLLEAFRTNCPESVFIFTSTSKVYGDRPNFLPLVENELRYDFDQTTEWKNGISEKLSIDQSMHSIFGASKVAADIMVQEYGKYFNLATGVFRGGCLTGAQHAAVELHGYLAHIVNCAKKKEPYTIYGYKGKQVRDQIHSSDVVNCFWNFYRHPRCGEVYNIGGMKKNSISILETIKLLEENFDLKLNCSYSPISRIGDHIVYYTNMSKFKRDYPDWKLKYKMNEIVEEMINRKTSSTKK